MADAADLIQLPWQTLLTLASGYSGYFVAHVGIRGHHSTADVVFGTLVFGFLGQFVGQSSIELGISNILLSSLACYLGSIVSGGLWAKFGRDLFDWIIGKLGVSQSDDLPTAWLGLSRENGFSATQLTVTLTDGRKFQCSRLLAFKDEANGPCTFGGEGDIIMYVTGVQTPEGEYTEIDVLNSGWGPEATYIPKDQIKFVDIRRVKDSPIS